MSDNLKKNENAVVKKPSFFARLILGNSVPKVRKKKVIRKVVSETPETVPPKELPNSPRDTEQKDVVVVQGAQIQSVPEEIIAPIVEEVVVPKLVVAESNIEEEKPKELVIKKLTVSIVEDNQNEREGGVVESPTLLRPAAKDHQPVPFDEGALFVPLRSAGVGVGTIQAPALVASSEGVLSESEYYYLGDGKALTSLQDFLIYVESLSDEEWKRSVHDRKSNFVIWIEAVFGTGKLARLIELADSQKEAVLYIRSYLGK